MKKASIIPTLRVFEPRSSDALFDVLDRYIALHIDLVRINMNRSDITQYTEFLGRISKYYKSKRANMPRIILDIPYPKKKLRTQLTDEDVLAVTKGDIFTFSHLPMNAGSRHILTSAELLGMTQVGGLIMIGDGEISFEVQKIHDEIIEVCALNSNVLRGPRAIIPIGSHSVVENRDDKKLKEICALVDAFEIDTICLSFVENVQEIKEIKAFMAVNMCHNPRIIAKLETKIAIERILEICEVADSIMIGRGDLGLFSHIDEFTRDIDHIVDSCAGQNVEVLMATDILNSLVMRYIPNRAEMVDFYYWHSRGVRLFVLNSHLSIHPALMRAQELITNYGNSN